MANSFGRSRLLLSDLEKKRGENSWAGFYAGPVDARRASPSLRSVPLRESTASTFGPKCSQEKNPASIPFKTLATRRNCFLQRIWSSTADQGGEWEKRTVTSRRKTVKKWRIDRPNKLRSAARRSWWRLPGKTVRCAEAGKQCASRVTIRIPAKPELDHRQCICSGSPGSSFQHGDARWCAVAHSGISGPLGHGDANPSGSA